MSMEQDKREESFDPHKSEDRAKARALFKKDIEKAGLPAHRVIKITDTFYDILNHANEDQLEFLVGMAFAMFDNVKKVWVQKRMKKQGLITPDQGITKLGG